MSTQLPFGLSLAVPFALLLGLTSCEGATTTDSTPTLGPEVCDGLDNDGDGLIDEDALDASTYYRDNDGDTFGGTDTVTSCGPGEGWVTSPGDCNDDDANTYPGATELCDGIDNDCDTEVDEGVKDTITYYADSDRDGYGSDVTKEACSPPDGYVLNSDDCNDFNNTVHPDADEYCNGVDDDCDLAIDEDAVDGILQYQDRDIDGYGNPDASTVSCALKTDYVLDNTDCDDRNAGVSPGALEYCNGIDDDCDGTIDEDDAVDAATWYSDSDRDGYSGSAVTARACYEPPKGFTGDNSDCDDTNADIYPGSTEYCNGVDDDCDGTVDENDAADALAWYIDADGDGYGSSSAAVFRACSLPPGYSASHDDCNDSCATCYPGGTEICDGLDNNCDGTVDEIIATDHDGDGYSYCDGDCNDEDATIYPGAPEPYIDVDSNCDGVLDETTPTAIIDCWNMTTHEECADGAVTTCDEISLVGSRSFDTDGDPITDYSWTIESMPSGSRMDFGSDADDMSLYATPDEEGTYSFGLVVTDDYPLESEMTTYELDVEARSWNNNPVAAASTDTSGCTQTVTCTASGYSHTCSSCSAVTIPIIGSGSYDIDGDALTPQWTLTSGSSYGALSDDDVLNTTLLVNSIAATYGSTTTVTMYLQLDVYDCASGSSSTTLAVSCSCTGV
jgi:hypothetical protein